MLDLFNEKDIKPMLIGHDVEPYNDKDSIFELKLDGIRCIAYIDKDSVVLRNKRNKDVTNIYPELLDIYKYIKKRCILDGELIVLKDGKPDFFSIQKRSLMTDSFKIKLAQKNMSVSFVAFDILYLDDENLLDLPLIKRKILLADNIKENKLLSISRYIEEKGIELFELAASNLLEGVVGKKKDSKYYLGKRTKNWKKIKAMIDEDLIICGYSLDDEDNVKDLILGYYDKNGELKCRGKISLGISNEDKKIIKDFAKGNTVKKPWFSKYDNVVWLRLELVGVAHYMHKTDSGSMRQPVWHGLRTDKEAKDCVEY